MAFDLQASFELAVNDPSFARRLCDGLLGRCPSWRRFLDGYSRGALEKRIAQALAQIVDVEELPGALTCLVHELASILRESPGDLGDQVACFMSVARGTLAEVLTAEWTPDIERAWLERSAELEQAARLGAT
ncbi:MAG: hypothetical protein U0174_15620 [Polyangiaceae bacterium]